MPDFYTPMYSPTFRVEALTPAEQRMPIPVVYSSVPRPRPLVTARIVVPESHKGSHGDCLFVTCRTSLPFDPIKATVAVEMIHLRQAIDGSPTTATATADKPVWVDGRKLQHGGDDVVFAVLDPAASVSRTELAEQSIGGDVGRMFNHPTVAALGTVARSVAAVVLDAKGMSQSTPYRCIIESGPLFDKKANAILPR